MRRRQNCGGCGLMCMAFGAGLIACCILPSRPLIVILAIALLILGFICIKC